MRRTAALRILLVATTVLQVGTSVLQGQNMLDEQGRKTGPWKVDYPDGGTRYSATFQEGEPVGEMVQYYETGIVSARMDFYKGSDRSFARLYYKSGKQAAEGLFVDKKKDSVWTYYSEYDGTVRIRETFMEGELNGESRRYYPSGSVSEVVGWVMGSREGPWLQYFDDGTLRLKGHYQGNLLNGPYEVYTADSTLVMRGLYSKGNSTGLWSYFDEQGELLYELEYENGNPVDREAYMKFMQDTLLSGDTIVAPEPFQLF
jgi:antitoxin component YwqK of YwqJK toxin-antitoxin module